jgi:hypothetical protein
VGSPRKVAFISDYKNPALSLQKNGKTRTGHLAEFGAVADRHGQRHGLEGETAAAADRPSHSALKANAVIETKQRWLEVQQSKLKLVGRRIALAMIFFLFRETIRFLD